MQLKSYQNDALRDLARFIELLGETNSLSAAYSALWEDKGVTIAHSKGLKGFPAYQNTINDVPHVCIKIPTGGGKTYVAAAAVKTIFDRLPGAVRFVVWLVPSTAILEQTLRNLKNVHHDYRKRLNVDFSGGVSVYKKDELLNATNFSPSTVTDNLTICVLSYDSLRTKSKDGRLIYRENGSLLDFGEDISLFEVIKAQNPVVIVDESHNAASELSKEMLASLNPSFILDLTATPKDTSNVIHITPAAKLKAANMVKLPVVVYRRPDKESVVSSAVNLRNSLEDIAKNEDNYIRPIVLFQAQPKTNDDSETFDKLKQELINAGIPAEQVAIKTGSKDELAKVDLLSPVCEIRYIITINALKEGWDCPFAYILATIANKSSTIDVEQIVGRILRLPYATQPKNKLLANSYVFSCSNDFHAALDKVVAGLNSAGFSDKDMRAPDPVNLKIIYNTVPPLFNIGEPRTPLDGVHIEGNYENEDTLNTSLVASAILMHDNQDTATILNEAKAAAELYEKSIITNPDTIAPELIPAINNYSMNPAIAAIAEGLVLPQFVRQGEASLFEESAIKLIDRRELSNDFHLAQQDAVINFSSVSAEAFAVDVTDATDSPVTSRLAVKESEQLRRYFASLPKNTNKKATCIKTIAGMLDSERTLGEFVTRAELEQYIGNVFSAFDDDRFAAVQADLIGFKNKIKDKIEQLLTKHREKQFSDALAVNEIQCIPYYKFPLTISPSRVSTAVQKSLYEREGEMNNFEWQVISEVAAQENVVFWHRILDRKGFCLNGFLNHYPDFMIYTNKENIILLETKGDDRDNSDSANKLVLGRMFERYAGIKYKYFMVFENNPLSGANALDDFMSLIGKL